jgi:hypothetical protein
LTSRGRGGKVRPVHHRTIIAAFAALAFEAAAAGASDQMMPSAAMDGLSTADLARRFLPAENARRAVSLEVVAPHMEGGMPAAIRFVTQARSAGKNICRRAAYYVALEETALGQLGAATIHEQADIRVGRACTKPMARFAQVQPAPAVEDAIVALRWLDWARSESLRRRSLSFEVECTSELKPDPCSDDPRGLLARLPLERSYIINASDGATGDWHVAVAASEPGQDFWDVRIARDGSGRPIVRLNWAIPAPF